MQRSPKRASFERLLVLGFLLLLPPFLAIVFWRSGNPQVLGMWSARLFVVLCGYAGLLLASGWLVFHRSADDRRTKLMMGIVAARHIPRSFAVAAALPLLGFVAALLVVYFMGVVPSPLVLGCLLNLFLLVLWAEAVLLLTGRNDKQRRQLLMKMALAGGVTLITLLVIEVVAAVFGVGAYATWDINPRKLDVPFRTDDFDTRVVTNAQGLRETDTIPEQKPDGVFRIIVVGDSMTFGWGVQHEQAYPKVVESVLNETVSGANTIEVINMGRPGAGPHEYLKYLRKYASQLNPDLIVVGFLVGNDAPINSPATLKNDADIEAALRRYVNEAHEGAADQWLSNSFLIRLGYSILRQPGQSDSKAGVPGPIFSEPNPLGPEAIVTLTKSLPDSDAAIARYDHLKQEGWIEKGLRWEVNPWLMHSIVRNPGGPADTLAVRPETYEAMQTEWKLVAKLLDEIQTTAKNDLNAPLVVLAIPNAHLVSQRWVDFLEARGCHVNDQMTTDNVVNRWLSDWCRTNDVPLADPLDRFREAQTEGDDLYLKTDDHMTPKGYALLASELAKVIRPLLPQRSE